MPHISIRELNHIVQEAKNWYLGASDAEADNAEQYLNAFKAARLREFKQTREYSESLIQPENILEEERHEVKGFYYTARDFANTDTSERTKEQLFEDKLREILREQFIIEDPVFAAINEIDRFIQQFRSPANWFQRSAKAKIAALEELKEQLLTSAEKEKELGEKDRTIPDIIDAWKLEHEHTIHSLRNFFTSSRSHYKAMMGDSTTSTADFIERLRLVYQHETSSLPKESLLSRTEKVKFYQPFLEYIQSRTSWFQQIITFIFRKTELSNEKLAFAQGVVEDIQDSKGSYTTLRGILRDKRREHAALSKKHGKPHYNLTGRREPEPPFRQTSQFEEIDTSTETRPQQTEPVPFWERRVKKGEIPTSSDLANAFHHSISATM